MSPTIKQQAVCLFTGNISKTPFLILIASQREMYQSQKGQCKNLAQAMYYKDTPKAGYTQYVSSGFVGRTNKRQTRYLKSRRLYI